ncbi:uncharacterized protein ACRADG_012208 isoform 9-T13 [Cochliomyia hominivorax]
MESTSELVPNTVADKTVGAVEVPEKTNDKNVVEEHVTITVKKRIEGDKVVEEKTVTEKKAVEKTDSNSAEQEEVEEIVEEVEVEDDEAEGEEGVDQKITEEVVETPDGGQTKTITVTTVKKTTPGNTKTVVTTTSVTKETPTSTSTIIMTTPPTPTTEEVKTETTEDDDKRTKEIEEVNEHEDVKKEPEVKEVNEHEDVKKEPEVKEVNEEKVVHEAEEEEEEEEEEEDEEEEEEEEEKLNDKKVNEVKKSEESDQQNKDQVQIPERDSQPEQVTPVKEETVVDAPSDLPQNNQNETASKQDSNIKAEENIAALKQRELELLKKQQELAKEIEQQRILAQKLANENLLKQQQQQSNNLSSIPATTYQPTSNVSKYSTFEEKQDNNVFTRKSETFETRESTNVSKKIDLHKIFTPATDAEEILPKNRKLYASSAFYSPTLHPTVEDQVELARRISHSLSDISNQQSRGQSMYVNRKKRSVKWVHEGCGQEEENIQHDEYDQEEKENSVSHHEKVPLKFLMNPNGQMRDINSLRESLNTETGLLSPDVSAEVVTALQTQKGKGAELFAKRRKVSEKWVVDENNVGAQSPSGLPDYHQYQQPRPSTSPSILPAYTDAAKHRVQLNLHQEQLLEKYAKPGLKVVQTPWEAALNSGSASAAFVEEQKLSPYQTAPLTPSPTPQLYDASQGNLPIQSASTVPDSYRKPYSSDDYNKYPTQTTPLQQTQYERQQYSGTNSQRELAYKPSIPQGWKAPSMSLPKDLYMPKEIPLQSYAPPPVSTGVSSPIPPFSTNYESNQNNTYKPLSSSPLAPYSAPEPAPAVNKTYSGGGSTFPVGKPYQQGFSSSYGSNQPPKQQYLPPQSYQKVPQNTSQNIPQVNFNPSPLPYDKLAKFENQPADDGHYIHSPTSRVSHLNVRGSKVRNTSPAPFGGSYNRSYTPSSEPHHYGGTPSHSPRPLSSLQQYSGHNTPNSYPSIRSNQILNAPSYNTSARGWGCNTGASTDYHHTQSHISAPKPQIVNAASMPYTDF